ncbi:MAG: HAD-IA family hydrolase [Synechococcaceae cyanobacterium SM2_3_2]|nr:HAD-IA family hydrolase [Synechococcaceae cyanobacterium SM2_3_2]
MSEELELHYSPVEVIFFDAVGTLFGIRGSVGEIYAKAAAAYGVMVDPLRLEKSFYQTFGAAPPAAFPGIPAVQLPEAEQNWWRAVVQGSFEQVGVQVSTEFPAFESCFQEVYDLFATADAWMLYDETLEVLQSLKGQGIRLGMISNFDTRLYPVLKALGLDAYFSSQQVTLSTVVGAAKPDRQVFLSALDQHGIPVDQAGRALHLGDSLRQDYQGAIEAGLRGLWLNRAGEPGIPDLPETAIISNLREIENLLGNPQ